MAADNPPEADPDVRMTSFVLRFVHDRTGERAGARQAGWHGLIRHVQSNEERHFSRWADAVAFIARYVEVEPAAVEVEPTEVEPDGDAG
jgi:hypothetical protein